MIGTVSIVSSFKATISLMGVHQTPEETIIYLIRKGCSVGSNWSRLSILFQGEELSGHLTVDQRHMLEGAFVKRYKPIVPEKFRGEIDLTRGCVALRYTSSSSGRYGSKLSPGVTCQLDDVTSETSTHTVFNSSDTYSQKTKTKDGIKNKGDRLPKEQSRLLDKGDLHKLLKIIDIKLPKKMAQFYKCIGNLSEVLFVGGYHKTKSNYIVSSTIQPLNISYGEMAILFGMPELSKNQPTPKPVQSTRCLPGVYQLSTSCLPGVYQHCLPANSETQQPRGLQGNLTTCPSNHESTVPRSHVNKHHGSSENSNHSYNLHANNDSDPAYLAELQADYNAQLDWYGPEQQIELSEEELSWEETPYLEATDQNWSELMNTDQAIENYPEEDEPLEDLSGEESVANNSWHRQSHPQALATPDEVNGAAPDCEPLRREQVKKNFDTKVLGSPLAQPDGITARRIVKVFQRINPTFEKSPIPPGRKGIAECPRAALF